MNKKEILEIRKQFTPEKNVITRICGCYVNNEKEMKFTSKQAFGSILEEEAFKYFDIFRHSLSGTIGKNLINMEFPRAQEEKGGTQEFLLKLRNSKLEDDTLLNEFYNKIIENYNCVDNYYIILIHAVYDVPGKSTDGSEMYDSSDTVYDYMLCNICPVTLAKAGLSYNTLNNCIEGRERDWIVSAPTTSFLFPVFTDRANDIHGVLYYSKNPEELQPDFIKEVLGSEIPMSASSQKETFHSIICETLEDECDYTIVKNIHETINEIIEERKDEEEPISFGKSEIKQILEKSEVPNDKLSHFDEKYDTAAGNDATLLASNLINTRKFSIETPDIVIKVNPERTDLVETKIIDGRKCLVIAVDDHIEVNGMDVKTL